MPESVAIVTGASQGIGRATAVRLAKDFSGVALAARKVVDRHVGPHRWRGNQRYLGG